MAEPVDKTFEHALFAAFRAGVAMGAGYPSLEAIPINERNIHWRAFRDAWAGDFWDPQRWAEERLRIERPDCNDRCYGEPCVHVTNDTRKAGHALDSPSLSFGAQMGHPGGHYG